MTDISRLRRSVLTELVSAGFEMDNGLLRPPQGDPKEVARSLHAPQRRAVLEKNRDFICEAEEDLLDQFADGADVDPSKIHPHVVPVQSDGDAALFRYAALTWAVPVSQGYGRRTRFLIRDNANGKLIGIFALGDPVFNLGARDQHIGWGPDQRQERLYNVFDAFVLGALDPYRSLLGGKLAALCTVSDEVLTYLEDKYQGSTTVILNKEKISRPVLITTSSALGRSSVYNRIRVDGTDVFTSMGFTEGFGHFQFSDALFEDLVELASERNPDLRGNQFGQGPNWKMRTIRSALSELGLPGDLLKHGIRREVFLAPVAYNWLAFLRGETDNVRPIRRSLADVSGYWQERWACPRAERRPEWRDWRRDDLRLSRQLPRGTQRLRLF